MRYVVISWGLVACSGGGAVDGSDKTTPPTDPIVDPTLDPTRETDADGDGFAAAVDCDDADPSIHPEADEVCNGGIDDDCNGLADDDDVPVDGTPYHDDLDGDGYGAAEVGGVACVLPDRAVWNDGDCDDNNADVNPDGREICNGGIDDDCDGLADDDDSPVDGRVTYYDDLDGDGFGDPGASALRCAPLADQVDDARDCDDGDGGVFPEAEEVCFDGVDQNCDGAIDEDCGGGTVLLDGIGELRYDGLAADDAIGRNSATVGDLNDDGIDDFAIGGRFVGADDHGEVYLYYGDPALAGGPVSGADAVLVGGGPDAGAGWSLLGAGDIDGDGVDDLLIGGVGSAWLLTDAPTGTVDLDAEAAASWTGAYAYDLAAADVDDDGQTDVVIGNVTGGGIFDGQVYVHLSVPSGAEDMVDDAEVMFEGSQLAQSLGCSVAAGDVTGDGIADIVIGAPGYQQPLGTVVGAVFVVAGPVTPGVYDIDLVATTTIEGVAPTDQLGWDVAVLPDVDGDGVDDIGAVADGADIAYIFADPAPGIVSASTAWATLIGGADASRLAHIASAGDVDGDGTPDLGIGDWNGHGVGSAHLLYGPLAPGVGYIDAGITFLAESASGGFNNVNIAGGDIDGDGLSDLLIGTTDVDPGGVVDAGSAFVILGGF